MRAIVRHPIGRTYEARMCDCTAHGMTAHAVYIDCGAWTLNWNWFQPVNWSAFALRRKTGWKPASGDGTGVRR